MLMTIGDFRLKVKNDMKGLAAKLQETTGRKTPTEYDAWTKSLPEIAGVLKHAQFDDLCIHVADRTQLSLEYKMPASSSYADVVLLGKSKGTPSAVILELKDWQTKGDGKSNYPGLIYHAGREVSHPSDQVKGYVEYCRNFHSSIEKYNAQVKGIVLFTKSEFYRNYTSYPNDRLVQEYPCFSTRLHEDVTFRLPRYLLEQLDAPDEEFARAFEDGEYKQRRSFVLQVSQQIKDSEHSKVVLLDHQRMAYSKIMSVLEPEIKKNNKNYKSVSIVYGPPGSGKSIVAIQLWAQIVQGIDKQLKDIVITTTSASQKSNWQNLINMVSTSGAKGIIKPATAYSPITTGEFGSIRKSNPDLFLESEHWRENLHSLASVKHKQVTGSKDNALFLSLVDEAHALINPEHSDGRGQHGFVGALGPQAYHIMRCSRHTVFFMDSEQGFRDQENTTVQDIEHWAKLLGIDAINSISLEDSQFRCGGSVEYINTIEAMLQLNNDVGSASENLYQYAADETKSYGVPKNKSFKIEVVETPDELDIRLKKDFQNGNDVRLLASYARKWKTGKLENPHSENDNLKDFYIPYKVEGATKYYSKIWNYAKGADYSLFIQGAKSARISIDPLCEIGCPYVVRGFDYDYVGLLWLNDLVWRKNKWVVNPDHVFETGFSRIVSRLKRETGTENKAYLELLRAVKQAYRILLTRPIKGIYIWCEDIETKHHLKRIFRQH